MPVRNTVYQLSLSQEGQLGEKRLSCAENGSLMTIRLFKSRPLELLEMGDPRWHSPCLLGGQPVSLKQCSWNLDRGNVWPLPLSCSSAVKDFVIVPLHTTPETSVREIDELADVYTDVKRRWNAQVMTLCLLNSYLAGAESGSWEGMSNSEGGWGGRVCADDHHLRASF